jgi:hypothetical protein
MRKIGFSFWVATRTIDDEWLVSRHSLLLRVPSAILPETSNILLNPNIRKANSDSSGTPSIRGTVPIVSAQTDSGTTYSYSLQDFFNSAARPTNTDTLKDLLTLNTACKSLDIGRRALGSLLHMVQDSFARGHVKRTLTNPKDLLAGEAVKFKPGKYGKYGEVENFHCYKGQDPHEHDKYDGPGDSKPSAANLDSFNGF